MEAQSQKSSFYKIKINKSDSELINTFLFSPKIYRFTNTVSVCGFLNFPLNWSNWELPKKLHKKNLEIISFTTTEIIVGW